MPRIEKRTPDLAQNQVIVRLRCIGPGCTKFIETTPNRRRCPECHDKLFQTGVRGGNHADRQPKVYRYVGGDE